MRVIADKPRRAVLRARIVGILAAIGAGRVPAGMFIDPRANDGKLPAAGVGTLGEHPDPASLQKLREIEP